MTLQDALDLLLKLSPEDRQKLLCAQTLDALTFDDVTGIEVSEDNVCLLTSRYREAQ